MTRKTDYLFLRDGSRNWQIKLQYPDGRIEKSLGTSDRAQAEILALPYIQEHKMRLLEARPGIQVAWQHRFAPGQEHVTPDGERVVADDRELIFLNHNGAIVRKEPNGEFAVALPPLREQKAFVRREEQRQRTATSPDDALIETYLKHKNVTGYYEREARAVWALYKQLTNGKPLKDASRDDGRKLVDYYEKQDLKSATIQKKIGWLSAAVNLAIDEATLLFRLLASTGMRLSEAFEIDSEMKERTGPKGPACRFIIVGRKTSQSLRRVPLPAAVLPFLPRKLEGRLFPGDPRAASKRLNRFLNDVGIRDPRKVVHSLRHRAQDRLRAAGCPEDLRWAILGHEQKTVAAGYGEGFPVPLLKRWIDKIGF